MAGAEGVVEDTKVQYNLYFQLYYEYRDGVVEDTKVDQK